MIEAVRCEVYNADYTPLGFTPVRRAILLYIKGKAEVLREHADYMIQTGMDIFPVPVQIRLLKLVKRRANQPAVLNQKNLFIRDNHKCQYCGRHRAELGKNEFLTRDHVHPKDLGGKDEWTNVVTACNKCNNKKANFILDQINMRPTRPPYIPKLFEILSKASELRRSRKHR